MKKREIFVIIAIFCAGLGAGFLVRYLYNHGYRADSAGINGSNLTELHGTVSKSSEDFVLTENSITQYILISSSPSLDLNYFVGREIYSRGYLNGNVFQVTAISQNASGK